MSYQETKSTELFELKKISLFKASTVIRSAHCGWTLRGLLGNST